MTVAAGGGGTVAAARSGPSFGVLCFYSFKKVFAKSLKVLTAHHYSEPELRLTAKGCLPTKHYRELYAGGYSRQPLCLE
jgi:hypothetical protein